MTTTVDLSYADRVARITFRSESGIQILSAATRTQLSEVLDQVNLLTDCRIVVIEAEGRTFIAGADLNELKGLNAESAYDFAVDGHRLIDRISRLPAVTIAAIHAPCVGGGCEMALACDMRMAASSARIGLPEVTLGLLPGWGGSVRAVRELGSAAARRIVLSGELFPAAVALQLGLVDEVVPDESFLAAVQNRVEMLQKRGPSAMQLAKSLLHQFERTDIRRELEMEAKAFAACYETTEPAEGVAAFLEKRAPHWI